MMFHQARTVPSRIRNIPFAFGLLALLAGPSIAGSSDGKDLAGTVAAEIDGKIVDLPLLRADYDVDIEGDTVNVSLTQTFINPTASPLNATYLFPLNQKAAVHAMQLELDGETITAQIREKSEAKAVFEQAKAEGKAASLLTQHRPNMFTQDIANLMPGETAKITMSYVQTVPKIDGAYELVIPMVVGPRYERADAQPPEVATTAAEGSDVTVVSGWEIDKLPEYPAVIGLNAPSEIDPSRVSLDLSLTAPVPIGAMWSDTHGLSLAGNDTAKTARFEAGREIDNRDFILRYELAAENHVAAGLNSHYDAEKGGHFSLLIEPPVITDEATVASRELVFVLDTSGSMSGQPMAAGKVFMRSAIKALRPDDHFRILRFSDNTSQFAARSLPASQANKRAALNFVSGLSAGGGTELSAALNAAFDQRQPAGTTRIVVFLTDGYIGDDRNVIATVSRRIGNARIYAFGIGDSVNRFLLDGMAKEGRGYARYVGLRETAFEAAEALAAELKTPVLTDISVDWNGLAVEGQTPAKIPDLFEGGSVRVLGRYKDAGPRRIFINAKVNGRRARMPLDVELKGAESGTLTKTSALPLIWAREQIFDKNRAYTIGGSSSQSLKDEITQLGLTYSLQSRFTSFVAVSQKVVNPVPGNAKQASVPLPQVSGVSANAYPNLNLSGSSAPEPEGILGILMVLIAVAARFWRRLRRMVRATWLDLKSSLGTRAGEQEPDTSLPRTLRRDGWWLDREITAEQ